MKSKPPGKQDMAGTSIENLLTHYEQEAQRPLEQARSLPFGVYREPLIFNLEMEHIFRNEWVFVVSEQELPEVGDYFALNLAGEMIALIRGQDGIVRAISNICRHRGTPLLDEGFGKLDSHIVCPYHAWTYTDTGALKAAPLVGDIKVDRAAHCLPKFHLESWHGLLFVHLGERPSPLKERFEGMDAYLDVFNLDSFKYGYRSGKDEHWQANWKLAMENAMESYHLFKVHETTLETITPTRQSYYIGGSSEWTLTGGEMVDTSSKLAKWFRGEYPKAFDHYVLISLPPSFVGILTYDSLSWIQVLPANSEHCLVRSAGISNVNSSTEDSTEKAFVEAFFAEDKTICERVQSGMHSQLAKGGKLVSMERIVVDFHQFLASRLFGSPVSDFYQTSNALIFTEDDG